MAWLFVPFSWFRKAKQFFRMSFQFIRLNSLNSIPAIYIMHQYHVLYPTQAAWMKDSDHLSIAIST